MNTADELTCEACNVPHSIGDRFCGNCGATLALVNQRATPTSCATAGSVDAAAPAVSLRREAAIFFALVAVSGLAAIFIAISTRIPLLGGPIIGVGGFEINVGFALAIALTFAALKLLFHLVSNENASKEIWIGQLIAVTAAAPLTFVLLEKVVNSIDMGDINEVFGYLVVVPWVVLGSFFAVIIWIALDRLMGWNTTKEGAPR